MAAAEQRPQEEEPWWKRGTGDELERNRQRAERLFLGIQALKNKIKQKPWLLLLAPVFLCLLCLAFMLAFQPIAVLLHLMTLSALLGQSPCSVSSFVEKRAISKDFHRKTTLFMAFESSLIFTASIRLIVVCVQAFRFRYPSITRRLLGLLLSVIESVAVLLWTAEIGLLSGDSEVASSFTRWMRVLALIGTSWILTMGEFWIDTSRKMALESEQRYLKAAGLKSKIVRCKESGMSFFRVDSERGSDAPVLVLAHGFFGGKAIYADSIVELKKYFNIYAIDWLGMGNSDRVFSWVLAFHPDQVETMFIVALEKWRKAQKIENMYLLGHSFGGYLVCSYAMRYPDNVDHLILASPLGLPPFEKEAADASQIFGNVISTLWNMRITPHIIIKLLGPFSKILIANSIRFRATSDLRHVEELKEYVYHINAAPLGGELGLGAMFQVGALAKRPLARRVLGSPEITKKIKKFTFIYGSFDWMDRKCGSKVSQALREQFNDTRKSQVLLLNDTGHQVFLGWSNTLRFIHAVLLATEAVPFDTYDTADFKFNPEEHIQTIP